MIAISNYPNDPYAASLLQAFTVFAIDGLAAWSDGRRARDSVTDLVLAEIAPVNDNLGSLLTDHPFEDDRDLLCTLDTVQSAGEARLAARTMADSLRAAGIEPGQGVAVNLPAARNW